MPSRENTFAAQTREEALANFNRVSASWDRMGDRLPKHQRSELLADLMEAAEVLDAFDGDEQSERKAA